MLRSPSVATGDAMVARNGDDGDPTYVALRQAVVEGRYQPGQRLVEQRLAEAFDVSRTPVRQALLRLESEGLVTVERHRGAQVRMLTAAEIADLYDVRARLEAYAAELAASRADAADATRLAAAADDFDRAVDALDDSSATGDLAGVRRLDEANGRFHTGLLDASRHTRIRQLVSRTVDLPLVFQALRHFGPADRRRSSLFHHLILEAVAAHEPERAGRLMAEHVLQGRDGLLERLAEAGGVTALFAP